MTVRGGGVPTCFLGFNAEREETAGRRARWRVRRYGDFVAGGVCPTLVEEVFADAITKVGGLNRTAMMGRTGIEQRFVDEAVAQIAVTASNLVAGREPAKLTCRFVMLPRTAAIMRCRS
jgi:hypothetical protein